jgi:hypothetical protein
MNIAALVEQAEEGRLEFGHGLRLASAVVPQQPLVSR